MIAKKINNIMSKVCTNIKVFLGNKLLINFMNNIFKTIQIIMIH
jgi:hypothetical protein